MLLKNHSVNSSLFVEGIDSAPIFVQDDFHFLDGNGQRDAIIPADATAGEHRRWKSHTVPEEWTFLPVIPTGGCAFISDRAHPAFGNPAKVAGYGVMVKQETGLPNGQKMVKVWKAPKYGDPVLAVWDGKGFREPTTLEKWFFEAKNK